MTVAKKTTSKKTKKKAVKKRVPTKKREPAIPEVEESAPEEKAEQEVSPRAAYRMRMELVGNLLNTAMDALPSDDAGGDCVGRGAYLNIMGQVFDALDGLSLAIPMNDDLVKLSKIVAEQRRAELNTRKVELADNALRAGEDEAEDDDFETRRLPAGFGKIVRQVYGASFADDVEPPGEE